MGKIEKTPILYVSHTVTGMPKLVLLKPIIRLKFIARQTLVKEFFVSGLLLTLTANTMM